MDRDGIAAIDVHVHAERNQGQEQNPVTGEILDAAARHFGGHPPQPTAQEVAHPSFPWQDEALAITVHKPKVHIDLSGWAPKITPNRWLKEFAELPIKDGVRPLVLKQNAIRLLKLDGIGTGS